MNRRAGKFFAVIILALALVFCFSVTAFADDTGDPITIDVGDELSFSGVLDSEGTHVTYEFSLPHSGEVWPTIEFTSKILHYEITNTDEDWRYLSGNPTTSPSIYSFGIPFEAGNYKIEIYSAKNDPGTFNFLLGYVPSKESYDQPNSTIVQARELPTLPLNKEITGFYSKRYRVDYFKFELEKAGKFQVKFGKEENDVFYCGLRLLDENEEVLSPSSYMYNNPKVIGDDTPWTLDLKPGIYYLEYSDQSTPKHEGSYHFTAKFTAATRTFKYDNDDISDAKKRTAIKVNKTVKDQIAVNDLQDYYKISIPKDGDYVLTVTCSKDNAWPFDISSMQKANGSSVRGEYSNTVSKRKKEFIYKGLPKGTYYLRFLDSSYYKSLTGPYSFVMKPAPPISGYKPVAGKKKLTAKWPKGTGNGYQVQIALNKKFTSGKKSATITKVGTTQKVFKSLKAKKTYYVRVRNYVKYSGSSTKYYSDWGPITSVKTKG